MLPRQKLRSRQVRIHSLRWQRRMKFAMGGVLVGLIAVGIAVSSDLAQGAFRQIVSYWPFAPLLITPSGFALSAFLALRYFPSTQGSGIPQVIAARTLTDRDVRAKLVGLTAAVGKTLLTLLGLLVGASIGREGPTVQVGASTMYLIGKSSWRRQPDLILAGAAAGVAAAFNTPLAGIVFAIEELSRSFEARASGLILGTIIVAGLTAQAILGDYTYFGFTTDSLPFGTAWLAIPVCGVIGGVTGAIFSRVLVALSAALPPTTRTIIRSHPICFAAMCGFGVVLCGLASDGAIYGTGYENARAALHHADHVEFAYAPLKLIATALSSLSGIPGGLFSPSLSIGAAIGSNVAYFFQSTAPGPIVLLGTVAYFTGVVRAPITGFVIVSEMSGNHRHLVALMATAVIADACARLINKEGVYHVLAKRFASDKHPT